MKLKKLLTGILAAIMVITIAIAAIGCGDKEVTVESIELNKTTAEFFAGESLKLDDYEITIKYSDGKTEKVALKEAMLNADDLSKLSNAGTYDVTVSASGKTVTLKVTVKNLDLTDAAIADKSVTYTGEAIYPDVTGIPESATVLWTIYEGEDATGKKVEEAVDAGTYFAEAKISLKNHNDLTLSAKIVINKKVLDPAKDLVWKNVNKPYTGNEITLNPTVEGLPEGIEIDSIEGDATKTEKGEYTVTIKFKGENKNYEVKDYKGFTWSILDATDLRLEKWYAAVDGVLKVLQFTDDALILDGEKVPCTIAYDEKGLPTVTIDAGKSVSSVTLNGSVLTLTENEEAYSFIAGSNTEKYTGDYTIVYQDFSIKFDELNKTAVLVSTVSGEESETLPVSLVFDKDAKDAINGKLIVDGKEFYFTYENGYYSKGLKINGYKNPANYDVVYSEILATKSLAEEGLKKLFAGKFVDKSGNTLEITNDNEVIYNGKKYAMYAESEFYGKFVEFYISVDSRNGKAKKLEIADGGCYVLDGEVFFVPDYSAFAGIYFFDSEDGIVNTQTVSFLEYERLSVKLKRANEKEGVEFRVGVDVAKDNVAELTIKDGVLTAKLYKQGTDLSGEPFATVTFNKNGVATTSDVNFAKVEKLIEKGDYFDAKGNTLNYDNKGVFTLGGNKYNKYTMSYGTDGTVTITLGEEGNTHTIVASADKRYVTVDKEIFLFAYGNKDKAPTNGFRSSGDYVNGDETVSINKNQIKIGEKTLEEVSFAFGTDGRKLLTVSGKIDGTAYSVEFYSLAVIKVNKKAYVFYRFASQFGTEFKPAADSKDTFTITEDGKVMFGSIEVFPTYVYDGGNSEKSKMTYDVELNEKTYNHNLYFNKISVKFDNGLDWNVNYYPSAYFVFNGLYFNADKTKVIYFTEDKIFIDESSTDSYTIKLNGMTSASITVKGKTGEFLKAENGAVTLTFGEGEDKEVFTLDKSFDLSAFFGSYELLLTNSYKTVELKSVDKIKKIFMLNGEVCVYFQYGSWGYETAYLVKNIDAATSADMPYLAIDESLVKLLGSATLNGKKLQVKVGVGVKPNSTVKAPVLNVLYDGETISLSRISNSWITEIDGKEYVVETVYGSNILLVYEKWIKEFKGSSYTLNGRTVKIDAVVNDNEESVIQVLFNGNVVEGTFSQNNKFTFSYENVNYVLALIAGDPVMKMRLFTEKEYELFFEAFDVEKQVYAVKVDGKDFLFDYTIVNNYKSYTDKEFSFDVSKTKYNGKAAIMASYVYDKGVVVFATEDGGFVYDVNAKTIANISVPANAELAGLNVKGSSSSSSVADISVIGRVEYENDVASVKLYYKVSSTYNEASATKIDGGFKLSDETTSGTVGVSYLLKEDKDYALYGEEQYMLVGTYQIGTKNLVITGEHKNGAYSYKASYAGSEAVAITPDFKNKRFNLTVNGVESICQWSVDSNGNYVFEVLPKNTYDFVKSYDLRVGVVSDNDKKQDHSVKFVFSGVVNGDVTYSVKYDYKNYVGVLSEDATYIKVTIDGKVMRFYLNGGKDGYYSFAAIDDSVAAAKMLGTFKLGENDSIVIKLYTKSFTEEEFDEDEYEYYTVYGGCESKHFVITYKGSTVTVDYTADVSNGIEFKINGKTYVAKLDETGKMTVAEKA